MQNKKLNYQYLMECKAAIILNIRNVKYRLLHEVCDLIEGPDNVLRIKPKSV